jgi:two-component system cell cycle response regulator
MKILIADDETLSRKLLEKTLERAGYKVTAVENGRLAAQHLGNVGGPRLALLDWEMPELDGPGVCREIRKTQNAAYVYMVLLTSKETKQDIVAGLGAGADDYLTKPFDPEELKARLRTGQRILDLEDRLVEAREEMRFKATHDALTSLWNRGMIMELLGRELNRAHREQGSTVVILCDLDHFKKINDTYGHVAGDAVLKEAAQRLLGSVRSYDFVGRYGGEEFIVALSNCDPAFAMARAECMRAAISSKPIETPSGPLNVTTSVGVLSSLDWGLRPIEEIVHAVDLALYEAKGAGRNCVRMASPRVSDAVGVTATHHVQRSRS